MEQKVGHGPEEEEEEGSGSGVVATPGRAYPGGTYWFKIVAIYWRPHG